MKVIVNCEKKSQKYRPQSEPREIVWPTCLEQNILNILDKKIDFVTLFKIGIRLENLDPKKCCSITLI